ncbi:hypothetical protein BJ742DRAFT_778102 [Cladochytrium replicatum]|nr:hypothetical protein BJ742DRAFT_778102 [Cladochytrium replicatum]
MILRLERKVCPFCDENSILDPSEPRFDAKHQYLHENRQCPTFIELNISFQSPFASQESSLPIHDPDCSIRAYPLPELPPNCVVPKAKLARPYFQSNPRRNAVENDAALWKNSVVERAVFDVRNASAPSMSVRLSNGIEHSWPMPGRCRVEIEAALKTLDALECVRCRKANGAEEMAVDPENTATVNVDDGAKSEGSIEDDNEEQFQNAEESLNACNGEDQRLGSPPPTIETDRLEPESSKALMDPTTDLDDNNIPVNRPTTPIIDATRSNRIQQLAAALSAMRAHTASPALVAANARNDAQAKQIASDRMNSNAKQNGFLFYPLHDKPPKPRPEEEEKVNKMRQVRIKVPSARQRLESIMTDLFRRFLLHGPLQDVLPATYQHWIVHGNIYRAETTVRQIEAQYEAEDAHRNQIKSAMYKFEAAFARIAANDQGVLILENDVWNQPRVSGRAEEGNCWEDESEDESDDDDENDTNVTDLMMMKRSPKEAGLLHEDTVGRGSFGERMDGKATGSPRDSKRLRVDREEALIGAELPRARQAKKEMKPSASAPSLLPLELSSLSRATKSSSAEMRTTARMILRRIEFEALRFLLDDLEAYSREESGKSTLESTNSINGFPPLPLQSSLGEPFSTSLRVTLESNAGESIFIEGLEESNLETGNSQTLMRTASHAHCLSQHLLWSRAISLVREELSRRDHVRSNSDGISPSSVVGTPAKVLERRGSGERSGMMHAAVQQLAKFLSPLASWNQAQHSVSPSPSDGPPMLERHGPHRSRSFQSGTEVVGRRSTGNRSPPLTGADSSMGIKFARAYESWVSEFGASRLRQNHLDFQRKLAVQDLESNRRLLDLIETEYGQRDKRDAQAVAEKLQLAPVTAPKRSHSLIARSTRSNPTMGSTYAEHGGTASNRVSSPPTPAARRTIIKVKNPSPVVSVEPPSMSKDVEPQQIGPVRASSFFRMSSKFEGRGSECRAAELKETPKELIDVSRVPSLIGPQAPQPAFTNTKTPVRLPVIPCRTSSIGMVSGTKVHVEEKGSDELPRVENRSEKETAKGEGPPSVVRIHAVYSVTTAPSVLLSPLRSLEEPKSSILSGLLGIDGSKHDMLRAEVSTKTNGATPLATDSPHVARAAELQRSIRSPHVGTHSRTDSPPPTPQSKEPPPTPGRRTPGYAFHQDDRLEAGMVSDDDDEDDEDDLRPLGESLPGRFVRWDGSGLDEDHEEGEIGEWETTDRVVSPSAGGSPGQCASPRIRRRAVRRRVSGARGRGRSIATAVVRNDRVVRVWLSGRGWRVVFANRDVVG